VVPQHRDGELTFVVVSPTGVELYLFTDLVAASGEVAMLNAADDGSS
jgi:hypothetical protein